MNESPLFATRRRIGAKYGGNRNQRDAAAREIRSETRDALICFWQAGGESDGDALLPRE
jgi:hypothetical protein